MDQTRDTNGMELYRLAGLYDAPGYVKAASAEQLRGDDRLPAADFADPVRRLYPMHTPAATWASYAFFTDKRASHSRPYAERVQERLWHAGRVHGIGRALGAIDKAAAAVSADEVSGLPDDDFAIVLRDEGGVDRHLPMRNSLETRKAAEFIHQFRDRLPFTVRQQAADRILEKVASLGVGLGDRRDFLDRQAGLGTCPTADAVALIRGRVEAGRGPGPMTPVQEELTKVASLFSTRPALLREPGVRVKLAAVLDRYDRETGLLGRVRDGLLPRVEDVLFSLTGAMMKSAACEHTCTTTNHLYRLADVERLKLARVRETLGDDVADAISRDGVHVDGEKAAAVVPTLPRPDAELFDALMTEAGLTPLAKQASAFAVERDFLLEAAGHFKDAGVPLPPVDRAG